MASTILYPPILDSYMPAFIAGDGKFCRVYFSLSKFNSFSDFSSVQATVIKQESGMSVVNDLADSYNHYRATGVILNLIPHETDIENVFYIDIHNYDLKSMKNGYKGWIPGWIYKIQIRLSAVDYLDDGASQANWMNLNASKFSEWSTICVTKAIGNIDINIENFMLDTLNILDSLSFKGRFNCSDSNELLHSYKVYLYEGGTLLEESGMILSQDGQNIKYNFNIECEDNIEYTIIFNYETINKYKDSLNYNFKINDNNSTKLDIIVLTVENAGGALDGMTSIGFENDEGRVALKLAAADNKPYTGKICVRRTDSRSNFKEWSDIKIINFENTSINDYILFYDYTIESGVYYKYGVLGIASDGTRGRINITDSLVLRDFDYAYLLGEENQQLKLMFNNTMSNYKINVSETKIDTLGKFAKINRNGDMYYQAFPITGMITFNMDEAELFATRAGIYGNQTIANLYNSFKQKGMYDMIFEREFRKEVLKFLYNGKPKLFKSTTEGNIIVKLIDITCTPQQNLDRLIYSFSCNAIEIADANMDNYKKYNFYKVEE